MAFVTAYKTDTNLARCQEHNFKSSCHGITVLNKHKKPVLSSWPMINFCWLQHKAKITQIIVGCRTRPWSLFHLNTEELQFSEDGMNFAVNIYLKSGQNSAAAAATQWRSNHFISGSMQMPYLQYVTVSTKEMDIYSWIY